MPMSSKSKIIKDEVIKLFSQMVNSQCEKGIKKYGYTLDECPVENYEWKNMIIEELIDCIQYQQKEIHRLENQCEINRRNAIKFAHQGK
jgi:hypothetical protein